MPTVQDVVLCFGSQSGKTTIFMGGAAWCACCDACAILWAMPSVELMRSFSETRWQPILRASPEMSARIPTGRDRHAFKTAQQVLGGGAQINFIGSNSPGNLASRPARRVILDEIDKFDEGGGGEADAVNLAEQRTKSFSYPQRWKSSTPTLSDGLIWQEFKKGDQRRYMMPCPRCSKDVLFCWSKEMTVFDLTGNEAFVGWDKESKRPDGSWDFAMVFRTAHAVCPHCAGKIMDGEKTKMVRAGRWVPQAASPSTFRSYHLPSLYASTPQTSFGALAVKFLQAKRSLQGLQGFINGDLAEPWENQDSRSARVEIVLRGHELDKPVGDKPIRLLACDVQFTSPHFYLTSRDWAPNVSRLGEAFTCETFEDVRAHQIRLGVQDNHVGIDCNDQTEAVYDACSRWGKRVRGPQGAMHVGWLPMRGRDKDARWKDAKTGKTMLCGLEDCALAHKHFTLKRLEFSGPMILDIIARLRAGAVNGIRWELTEGAATDEYFRHIDAKVKKAKSVGRTGKIVHEWCKRSERWPDHWLDCEIEQIALALFLRILPWGQEFEKTP